MLVAQGEAKRNLGLRQTNELKPRRGDRMSSIVTNKFFY